MKRDLTILLFVLSFVAAFVLVDQYSIKPVPSNAHMVTETYVVQKGDTLDSISYKFVTKSCVKRDVREFRSGIEETNYELLKGRTKGLILEGDKLVIKYYAK